MPEEKELLAEMAKRGATPLEIAAAFPNRTWDAISRQLKSLGPTYLDFPPRPYEGHLTYCQHLENLPRLQDGEARIYETCNRRQ